MNRIILNTLIIVITATLTLQTFNPAIGETLRPPVAAPEFTHTNEEDWINSEPLKLNQFVSEAPRSLLRGIFQSSLPRRRESSLITGFPPSRE